MAICTFLYQYLKYVHDIRFVLCFDKCLLSELKVDEDFGCKFL